jgi:hypothetical protein
MAFWTLPSVEKTAAPIDDDHWTQTEVGPAAFVDALLGRRFGELLRQLAEGMGGSIPLACQDWASTKAAYMFLTNARVDEAHILSGHFAATRHRFTASVDRFCY